MMLNGSATAQQISRSAVARAGAPGPAAGPPPLREAPSPPPSTNDFVENWKLEHERAYPAVACDQTTFRSPQARPRGAVARGAVAGRPAGAAATDSSPGRCRHMQKAADEILALGAAARWAMGIRDSIAIESQHTFALVSNIGTAMAARTPSRRQSINIVHAPRGTQPSLPAAAAPPLLSPPPLPPLSPPPTLPPPRP